MVLVVFGNGKCPICGDFAKELEKKTFHCPKCRVAFDDFIMTMPSAKKYTDKYWN